MLMYLQLVVLTTFFLLVLGQENLTVRTRNGLVLGTAGSTVDSKKLYYAFRGIPYAEPPVGNLRFSAPVPVRDWSGTLNATVDKSICVQKFSQGSEDCLYLNVYTPKVDPEDTLPVMVWIYGGYFIEGDSRYESFGPDYLLEENVVIITFNYRVGVFGFLSTSDMAASGNWGIKDQILALTWVQDNIRNFGGDPNKVTLFGQSAGSASVAYILQAPLKRKLFRAAIMESGVSLCLWAFYRRSRSTAFKLGRSLGIVTTNSTILVNRLRQVDFYRLNIVSLVVDLAVTALTNPRDGLVYGPSSEPYHDGAVVLGKSHQNLEEGNFRKVPVIIGFTSQEGLLFLKTINRLRLYLLTYEVDPIRLLPEDMNVRLIDLPIVAVKIRSHYFNLALITLSTRNFTQYITDDQFVRPVNEAVRLISNYTNVYYYKFSYMGALGVDSNKPRQFPGVAHAEELIYMWRQATNIQNPSESDLLTRRRLVKLWTNFAKTLNPTPEKDTLFQNVTWDLTNPQFQQYLNIGKNLAMGSDLSQYSIEWWENLYQDYGNPSYDTY